MRRWRVAQFIWSRCIAYTDSGKPATVPDDQRGGLVCHAHTPKKMVELKK